MERRMSMKVSCTVWNGGKLGDYIKELPIVIAAEDRGLGNGVLGSAFPKDIHCGDNPVSRAVRENLRQRGCGDHRG